MTTTQSSNDRSSQDYDDTINRLQAELDALKKDRTIVPSITTDTDDLDPISDEDEALDREEETSSSEDQVDDESEHEELDDSTYEDLINDTDPKDDHDEMILESVDNAAFRILGSMVYYDTKNWINPATGKPYNRLHLNKDLPKFTIRQHQDDDIMAEFVINRQLADHLATLFSNIRKSFDGEPLDRKRQPFSIDRIKKSFADTWKYEPLKIVLTTLLVVIVIAVIVYGFIVG